MSDSKWGTQNVNMGWNTPYGSSEWNPCGSGHTWVDTGMRRTFCKTCDADGDLDPMTGIVTVVFRAKHRKEE